MALTNVTVHGLQWSIDTNDWLDASDAAVCEQWIIEGLRSLSNPAATHKALLESQKSLDDPELPFAAAPREIETIEYYSYKNSIAGYAREPESGHNSHIVAIASGSV